ncbi:hypothetical protein BX666DRAFT_2011926 [Dichotomocladium elegans]|nr:hypothetical protein BX666DRAFT_2011926 [Dichotomocladium elegans]
MSSQSVLTAYLCFLVIIPLLVEWNTFRNAVNTITHQLLSQYTVPADLATISLAFACFYTFVLSDFIINIVATIDHRLSIRLRGGFHSLQQLFPAYGLSIYLIKSNTNVYAWHGRALVHIQSIVFLFLPFFYNIDNSNNGIMMIAYRSVLAWSLLYSIVPHETANLFWYMARLNSSMATEYYVL